MTYKIALNNRNNVNIIQGLKKVLGLKAQMALAATGAIFLCGIIFEASYLLTPEIDTLPMPKPILPYQIEVALFWIGLSALIAFSIVGTGVLINRIRKKSFALNQ